MVETFESTEIAAARSAPVNVYYHFYSGERVAFRWPRCAHVLRLGRRRHSRWRWLFTSEYLAIVAASDRTHARAERAGASGTTALRTVRFDDTRAGVDLALTGSPRLSITSAHLAGPSPR